MNKKHFSLASISLLLTLAVWLSVGTSAAYATNYRAQIKLLNDRNKSQRDKQEQLETVAHTLRERINILRHRAVKLRAQIAQNNKTSKDLKATIAAQKKEIAKQKYVLGVNVRHMYLDGQTSTLEKLASSKDLSEYVDKQQYRVSVQDKIQSTLKRIKTLQAELEKKKVAIDQLLEDQRGLQSELDADRQEKDQLMSMNHRQQRAYNQDINENNAQIAELRRQQAAENARNMYGISYAGTGSYPWANVPFPNSMPDPWGMYKRQCVSYAAWKVASTGRRMPYWGGRGNANQWDDNARAAGIPVDYSPRAGDIAVSNAGYYGHVMYVESVNGDGTISISQYNGDWSGRYSTARRSTAGLVFIHFR